MEQINHPNPLRRPQQATVIPRYTGVSQADLADRGTPHQHHHPVHTYPRQYLVANLRGDLGQKLCVTGSLLEGVPIIRNPMPRLLSGPCCRRKLKGEGADLYPLPRAEPAGGAALSPPADARAAAQVHAEDPPPELLQVGM